MNFSPFWRFWVQKFLPKFYGLGPKIGKHYINWTPWGAKECGKSSFKHLVNSQTLRETIGTILANFPFFAFFVLFRLQALAALVPLFFYFFLWEMWSTICGVFPEQRIAKLDRHEKSYANLNFRVWKLDNFGNFWAIFKNCTFLHILSPKCAKCTLFGNQMEIQSV